MPRRVAFILIASIAAMSGICVPADAEDGPLLASGELLSPSQPGSIVDNRAFVPSPAARPAHAPFDGDLVISEVPMQTVPADLEAHAVLGKDPQYFPALRLSFITVGKDLVPVTQEIVRAGSLAGGRSYWDIIVQPGRVWSEPSDHGWSRAAFPFALVHSLEGESHNGLATFLYRGHEVSPEAPYLGAIGPDSESGRSPSRS